ncbi:N,N-dimethylformamidase beta subunit family domain-containing protein [Leptospira stimsonii]|uniref:Uncharacterized protein n=1 Tax=Leptospira stimsonii TaxID=2202203 RepID=A0A396YS82_9LEPT|nr:N,N-dimethylformamidase beta subunit family domain-containing protein [Leptospira stimsonii]RHX84288.1 hypothetical protein DLM75_23120 [Leptospira stimsonii]
MLRIAFLLFFSTTFQFCNSDTNNYLDFLFSSTKDKNGISIADHIRSAQSVSPSNAPIPIYQYEYRDMYGSQILYYSQSANTPTAWTSDGVVFYAFSNPRTGTVPVYQYYAVDPGGYYRFMYSSNLYCAVGTSCGWYNSGVAFYAFPNPRSYTRPVYAYVVDSPQQRFFYSPKAFVGVGGNWLGWTNGGTAFYVPQIPYKEHTSTSEIEGYSSTTSVSPGETIRFYLNDPTAFGTPTVFGATNPLKFYKVGVNDPVGTENNVLVDSQDVDSCAPSSGCSWTATISKTIPATGWPSGLYYLEISDSQRIYFVVKSSQPAVVSNILMIIPFSTWQAYNTWGGTSTYPDPSKNILISPTASFNRPTTGSPSRHIDFISSMLSKKDINNQFPYSNIEFASDVDLHADPNLLNSYQLVIFVGQNEYISKQMRLNLDYYIRNGGNMAVFGGNTSWFQIRLNPDAVGNPNRLLICYKTTENINVSLDPFPDPLLKTFNWYQRSLYYPENQTFGLSFRYGTQSGPHETWTTENAREFEIKQANHWVFRSNDPNLIVQDFQKFGLFFKSDGQLDDKGLTAPGSTEGDSLLFKCEGGCLVSSGEDTHNKKMFATGKDLSPISFQILAYLDARNSVNYERSGHSSPTDDHTGIVMGVFENNGMVFNGGLYDWQNGLVHEKNGNPNIVSNIVWNVIEKLKQPKAAVQKATTAVYQYSDKNWNAYQSLYYSRIPFLPQSFYRNGLIIEYDYDGFAFYAYDRLLPGTVPIYQYQVQDSDGGQRFMYSPNQFCATGSSCLGWYNNGPSFYAYLSQQPGTIPVYSYSVDSPVQRFLYMPNQLCAIGTDCLGWHNNGPAFYVPDSK